MQPSKLATSIYLPDNMMTTANPIANPIANKPPLALYALTTGAFGIGTTEFVIMGLLLQVATDFHISIASAGLLITGYALGVFVGAPLLTALTGRLPRKTTLIALMAIFTIGNIACALAPTYAALMVARVITSLAHGTFFGVGSVVATGLVAEDRKASAIATMFTGLTVANLLGVPAGAWLGLQCGWRSTFWAVAVIGAVAMVVLAVFVRAEKNQNAPLAFRDELKILARPQVLLGLLMTVLGFAGVFVVFTYIQPLLMQVSGFSEKSVSPILLVFGAGLIIGNVLGGRFADRKLVPTLIGSLIALALVLVAMTFAMPHKSAAVVFTGLLGMTAFATVAPLQLRVLSQATGGGESLASSLNIAAFNLGNAMGAWLGGTVITRGNGLLELPLAAAVVTVLGLGVAIYAVMLEKRRSAAIDVAIYPSV
ncbi:MAG TPA: MFS transporter [Spongiibacteraceae bacterium]|nr:MFS transporter [Spongiibacteraceae bacterium]